MYIFVIAWLSIMSECTCVSMHCSLKNYEALMLVLYRYRTKHIVFFKCCLFVNTYLNNLWIPYVLGYLFHWSYDHTLQNKCVVSYENWDNLYFDLLSIHTYLYKERVGKGSWILTPRYCCSPQHGSSLFVNFTHITLENVFTSSWEKNNEKTASVSGYKK